MSNTLDKYDFALIKACKRFGDGNIDDLRDVIVDRNALVDRSRVPLHHLAQIMWRIYSVSLNERYNGNFDLMAEGSFNFLEEISPSSNWLHAEICEGTDLEPCGFRHTQQDSYFIKLISVLKNKIMITEVIHFPGYTQSYEQDLP